MKYASFIPLLLLLLFQGWEVFNEPFHSSDMGWIRVGDIGLSRSEWCASDVMTKCYCFPDSMTQRSTNPLPLAIRQAKDLLERTRQYNLVFDKADVQKWNIVPLLQPPKTVLGRMAAFIKRCDRMAHVDSPTIWVWHFFMMPFYLFKDICCSIYFYYVLIFYYLNCI